MRNLRNDFSDSGGHETIGLPLVCICIPTYNAKATILHTLKSVLSQTYSNLVIHVSDNASTDGTLEVVKSLRDPRVHIHANIENIGGEENFNRCIQLAEGKYTGIFHADDIYEPGIVANQVAFLEDNKNIGALFTAATIIDDSGNTAGIIGRNGPLYCSATVYDFSRLIKAILTKGNFLVCPSAMVRTQIYKDEIQRWRGELFRSSADLDVWLRIARAHRVAVLNAPLMCYRKHDKQCSHDIRMKSERADFFLVMDHYLAKPDVEALLGDDDRRHFNRLVRNNHIWRSVNQFIRGDFSDAKRLIRGTVNLDAICSACTSRRGFLMLMASVALHLMIVLRIKKSGQAVINALRVMLHK